MKKGSTVRRWAKGSYRDAHWLESYDNELAYRVDWRRQIQDWQKRPSDLHCADWDLASSYCADTWLARSETTPDKTNDIDTYVS